jgi:hypothetical protein
VAELGALSLKIEAIGDKQVLAALNAIESKARVVDKSATDAVAALKQLGIAAKTVGSQVAVAGADVEKATGLLSKMGLTAKVVSKENIEAAKVEGNANRVRARGFQEYLGLLTTGARLEGSRADAIRQLVSLESALQKQLQQTNLTFQQRVRLGETLSRVQLGIASGIEQTTLASQRGAAVVAAQGAGFTVLGQSVVQAGGKLTAFGKSGLNAFNAVAFGVSQMAATGQASFRSLATSAASVLAFFGPQGAITAAVIATGLVLVDFFKRQKKEITELAALVKRFTDDATSRRERDQPVLVSEERLAGVKQAIDANRKAMADLFDIEKRTVQLREGAFVRPVDQQALARLTAERTALLKAEHEALRQVNDARTAEMKGLETVRVTTAALTDVEAERQRAQGVEIDALASLAKARGATGLELLRLVVLEGDLTKELASGSATKEREAEIWERIAKARQTAQGALPSVQVRSLTPSTPQAARTLSLPPSLQAQLDPSRIQEDVQRTDAEMARRVAAVNFNETQIALSNSLAGALSSAIATGFAQGLGEGGIGEGFKQMSAQIAQGLGNVAINYGLQAIITGELMASISAFLIANPLLAIGAGVALVAFGRSIGGRGSGGGVGGGGGFGGSSSAPSPISISRPVTDPNAGVRQRVSSGMSGLTSASAPPHPLAGVKFLVVNDPGGKRYLAELVGDATGRGI